MSVKNEDIVNVRQVLKSRNPRLYKMIPGFAFKYLENIIHQDEMNRVLAEKKDIKGLDLIRFALFDYFQIQPVIKGLDRIEDKNKRYIFVGNHPMGGLDGLLFILTVSEQFGAAKAIINDLLLYIENLRPLFVGVNLYGDKSRESIKDVDKLFKSDFQVVMFPAGLVSRRNKGIIRDLDWKGTFVKKAVSYTRDVVPVHIDGRLSNFFYRISNLRKKTGIKKNIEFIYLPNEMFKQKGQTISLTFGSPISHEIFKKQHSPEQWAQKVKEHVYKLKDGSDPHFQ